MTNKKKIGFVIALILFIISLSIVLTTANIAIITNFIQNALNKDFGVNSNPIISPPNWNFRYLSFETGISTNITPISNTTLQLDIHNINGGGYKFASAICNISNVNSIGLQIQGNNGQYTSIGNANYGKLTNYGLDPTWCKETNGDGFILFSGGSKDRSYRLIFPLGEKEFIMYTGSGSEKVIASYSSIINIERINIIKFIDTTIGRKNNDNITVITYGGQNVQ